MLISKRKKKKHSPVIVTTQSGSEYSNIVMVVDKAFINLVWRLKDTSIKK